MGFILGPYWTQLGPILGRWVHISVVIGPYCDPELATPKGLQTSKRKRNLPCVHFGVQNGHADDPTACVLLYGSVLKKRTFEHEQCSFLPHLVVFYRMAGSVWPRTSNASPQTTSGVSCAFARCKRETPCRGRRSTESGETQDSTRWRRSKRYGFG
jgi:hypothetical protein